MSLEDIQDMARNSTTRPFEIMLADGRRLEVRHPEFVAVPGAGSRFVHFSHGSGIEVVALSAVVSLREIETPAATLKQE
ncbi:MAG TPA: hypothetical protein DDZ88_06985 [Verrucomicrobiales bacterium]|nr:hypothetical protein [Verrucomicrobiales bacterium]